tara:strand:+ start:4280 stop:4987 length:708 start_codon:yes stop_codon:yes gene_type:complete
MFRKIYLHLNILHKKIKSKKKYYSFSGVDIAINDIFRNNNNGIYLDVGCQHPVNNNNTFLLHQKGWEGINIDLDQDNIDLFNCSRPKDLNICAAISSTVKNTDLYFYHKKSPINTIVNKVSNFQKAKISEIKKIKTNTLNNLLKLSRFHNKRFDLMSVDVEGHELEVFLGFDFVKYRPNIIVVEFLDLSLSKIEIKNQNIDNIINSELYKFLTSKNYTLVNFIYADLIFVNNDFK